MKVGIIGCGTVSQYGHIPTLANMPGVELIALSDVNVERLEGLKQKYQVPHAFADYSELLALKGLDAVAVATPLHTHADIVCDAARAGLHVLCEKPLAHTVEDGERMIKAGTIKECSRLLEAELALFPAVRVYLLMGDVAIKALNFIAKRQGEKRVIPTGSTYKIRGEAYHYRGARVFPSYLQAGPSFFIEKSKRRMIAEDIAAALELVR